jgi:hypothetical protein
MTIHTPCADDLCFAPELAILAALEATLATTIQVLVAAHPELQGEPVAAEEITIDVDAAAKLSRQAAELIATINTYRLAIINPDYWPF